MRTQQEIISHYRESRDVDFFGFAGEVILPYLTVDQLSGFAEPKEPEKWVPLPLTKEAVLAEMRDYMEFAWSKVLSHRGISADRSVIKMTTWLWILERDNLLKQVHEAEYQNYGAPKLKIICDVLGFSLPTDQRSHRMMQSLRCRDDCDEGCV